MNAAVDHYLSVREELTLPGQGVAWLDALREQGMQRFQAVGFPTLRDENWRYTNVRSIQKKEFKPVIKVAENAVQTHLADTLLPGLQSHRIVFVNGQYCPGLSASGDLPAGVRAESLAAVVKTSPQLVERWLGSCTPESAHGFLALNTAFVQDGLYLNIADNCDVDAPIEVIFFSTEQGGQLVQPRNLYVIGRQSKVNIIERYISAGGDSHLTNAVTELVALESAQVEHTKLQEEGGKAFHVGGVFMHLDANTRVVSNNVALGSLIARTDLCVSFVAEGALCNLNGVYLGNGRQHIDNFTQVEHRQPNCSSDEFYKGVLDDRARAVFHGRVVVHQDAQHTDAQQQNRNLLLSENAEVDTKPQLEIYADDVKCAHGATVGQLDEDAMYYLRSRAIDEVTARSLLTYAFAGDVIQRFSLKPVRDQVESVLSRKLFGVDRLEELV